MKKAAGKKMRGSTLQEIELLAVTDPIELEALDVRRKANERALADRENLSELELVVLERRKALDKAAAAAARKAGKGKTPKRK